MADRRSVINPVPRALIALALASVALAGSAAALAAAASPNDDAIERRAVLRTSDFPAGWEKTPPRDPTRSGLDVCADLEAIGDALLPQSARSPEFVRPDTDNVLATGSVVVLKSAKQARGYLAPYRDPDAVRCLEAITESSLTGAGFTSVGVSVTPGDELPSGADEAAVLDVQITVTAPATASRSAQTAVIYQDVIVVRVGRALADFEFLNPAKPLPERDELVDAVIGRLQSALDR